MGIGGAVPQKLIEQFLSVHGIYIAMDVHDTSVSSTLIEFPGSTKEV